MGGFFWKNLLHVSEGARTGDARDDDRRALREVHRIGFVSHGAQCLHVVGRTHQRGEGGLIGTVLEEELVSSSTKLAHVVSDSFVLRSSANLLERRNGHGGKEADDDHDNHDFNEGEALGGVGMFHVNNS